MKSPLSKRIPSTDQGWVVGGGLLGVGCWGWVVAGWVVGGSAPVLSDCEAEL